MNQVDYQDLNVRCENALKDIDTHDIEQWLHKSSKLIKDVSIQPEGLPSIANAHYEGVLYIFISEFHRLYEQQLNKLNNLNQSQIDE